MNGWKISSRCNTGYCWHGLKFECFSFLFLHWKSILKFVSFRFELTSCNLINKHLITGTSIGRCPGTQNTHLAQNHRPIKHCNRTLSRMSGSLIKIPHPPLLAHQVCWARRVRGEIIVLDSFFILHQGAIIRLEDPGQRSALPPSQYGL